VCTDNNGLLMRWLWPVAAGVLIGLSGLTMSTAKAEPTPSPALPQRPRPTSWPTWWWTSSSTVAPRHRPPLRCQRRPI